MRTVRNKKKERIFLQKGIKKILLIKAGLLYRVVPRGFEPRQTESKSVVLPLYYGTKDCKSKGEAKKFQMNFSNKFIKIFLV